jgi:hypothetical protein
MGNRDETGVGYKRPPKKHQFKKGQKPPPRKGKKPAPEDAASLLWRVLQEPRRVEINGETRWVTCSELVAEKAFEAAERGNKVINRLITPLLLPSGDDSEQLLAEIITEPDGKGASVQTYFVEPGYDYVDGNIVKRKL